MKRLLLLSTIFCGSGFGAIIGTCVSTTLSDLVVGDPCALGNKTFSNFSYRGSADASEIVVDFQMPHAAAESRLIQAPVTSAVLVTTFTSIAAFTAVPGVGSNISPANYQIVGAKDQSNFSVAQGSAGLLDAANSPDPAFDPAASVTNTSTLSGLGGTGDTSPGLFSFELGNIQASTAVPEPATQGLVGLALMCAGLLRKRIAQQS